MGVNNRQRRAAEQRKRAKARASRVPRQPSNTGAFGGAEPGWFDEYDERDAVVDLLTHVVSVLQTNPRSVDRLAVMVIDEGRRIDRAIISEVFNDWLRHLVATVTEFGWAPSDLLEIVRRRGHPRQVPSLAALLHAETDKHPSDMVAQEWRDDLDRLPPPVEPSLASVRDVESVLGLAGVLITLPQIEPMVQRPGTHPRSATHAHSPGSSKHLTRVRALLAKAESTESAEEAEALSAKAQELISRYALDRLLNEPADDAAQMASRRIWIDAPYVRPKSSLISQIAVANRCRAVFTEQLEFITIIGEQSDLDAIELMTASLLVQAQRAMVAHGSQSDGWGTSRTRSFRQSFLVSFAARIGERLRAATDEAAAETGEAKALVPVLQRHQERVDAAVDTMFPDAVKGRRTSVTNAHGWAAGRAAADLASLDGHKNVSAAGASRP